MQMELYCLYSSKSTDFVALCANSAEGSHDLLGVGCQEILSWR